MAMRTVFTLSFLLGIACAQFDLTYDFQEEQSVGTYVGNIARDAKIYVNFTAEEFNSLTYAAFEQDDATKFAINKTTSTIRSAEVLDREVICGQIPKCELQLDVGIYLTRNKDIDLKRILRVLIILEDINDNNPVFHEADVTLYVAESIAPQQEILTSGAKDADVGLNGIKTYEIVPAEGMFSLNVMNNPDGTADLGLVVKYALDRETQTIFNILLIAKDGGTPQKSGNVTVHIHITDVNDNKPQFISNSFEETVLESAPLNIPVIQVLATDPDAGSNSKLTYSFSARTSDRIRSFVAINESSGAIYPIQPFDYEVEKSFEFYVQVNDNGSPSKFDQASVIIHIEDVNDNAPTVNINLPPSGTMLSEDTDIGTFIATVSVSDNDGGVNGAISCEIPDQHFQLNKFSEISYIYKIILREALDYEKAHNHVVNVTCHDQGQPVRTSFSSFELSVTDINDNAPIFTQPEYRVTFMENNKINDIVFRITATDKDSDLNSKLSYEKRDDFDMLFSIESDTGVIRANEVFNREVIDNVKFKVVARDFGSPVKSSTVDVMVIIGDQNDHSPFFNQPHFTLQILENQPIGTVVGKLNVTDLDDEANSKLLFVFTDRNSRVEDYFEIEQSTGIVKTRRVLDREVEYKFDFSVTVTDTGNVNFNDNAGVTIFVLDENDNSPIISFPNANNNTIYIPYTRTAGSVAAQIQATDLDTDRNGELVYSIQSGNNNNIFVMDKRAGQIVIKSMMRIEDSKEYPLKIAVQDKADDPKTTYSELNIIVTIGNGSLATYQSQQESKQGEDNSAIVITIVVVTLVLALTILCIIVIIYKIDKNRKKTAAAKAQAMASVRYDSPASESTFSTSEGNDDAEKQLKPERLHTLESVSSDGSSSMQSLPFAPLEQRLLKSSGKNGSTQSLKGRTTSTHHVEPVQNPYDSPNIHMWLENQTLTKIPEDSSSQLSGGTDRDSGRGTSEEDSKIYHSDPDEPKIFMSPQNNGSKRVRFSDNKKSQSPIPVSVPRTPVYLHNEHNPHPRDTVSRNIANSFRNSKNSVNGYEPKSHPNHHRGRNVYPPSSYSDIYNNSISESVNEDNCSTTTSGSYTIDNAYALCDDINNLFFKDAGHGTTVV
ncbi:hypothetical protein SNE40_016078 [Patella caerulea]|uniref:Cadherin domain-containing protein n=1 Tax=Patella caerulea TaxID=87958 RepID=A0AAN8J838_PATCE